MTSFTDSTGDSDKDNIELSTSAVRAVLVGHDVKMLLDSNTCQEMRAVGWIKNRWEMLQKDAEQNLRDTVEAKREQDAWEAAMVKLHGFDVTVHATACEISAIVTKPYQGSDFQERTIMNSG